MATCGHCGRDGLDVATIRAHYGQGPGADKDAVLARAAAAPTASAPVEITEGFWSYNGSIFKVQRAVHGSGHLYAKRLVVDGEGGASFHYAPGIFTQLANGAHALTKDEAAEFGKLYGVCCICGRTLTNEESIAAGIGPICAGKQGW